MFMLVKDEKGKLHSYFIDRNELLRDMNDGSKWEGFKFVEGVNALAKMEPNPSNWPKRTILLIDGDRPVVPEAVKVEKWALPEEAA